MIIDHPRKEDIPALRRLWKQAFGDSDAFLDAFFGVGFAYDRCRCVFLEAEVTAALYWFDGELEGEKIAYLYAIATDLSHRGQGLCRLLMADTQACLIGRGYTEAVLLPAEKWLEAFYGAMGYRPFGSVMQKQYRAGKRCFVRPVDGEEFALLRREHLPRGGIRQEGALLRFLATQAEFYAGEGFLAAISKETPKTVVEFLGDLSQIPGLLGALKLQQATVRTPGGSKSCGMYLPLAPDAPVPTYLGLPMD